MFKMQKRKNPPPPKGNTHNQSPQPQVPSLFDSMKQGLGFGVGSSIGHKAVDSLFNSPHKKDENISNENIEKECNLTVLEMYELYNKCLKETEDDNKCNKIIKLNKN